jgi:hypothetical protein
MLSKPTNLNAKHNPHEIYTASCRYWNKSAVAAIKIFNALHVLS